MSNPARKKRNTQKRNKDTLGLPVEMHVVYKSFRTYRPDQVLCYSDWPANETAWRMIEVSSLEPWYF
jgi:hypothetical protein